jgi:hypothetical protein
MNDRFSADDLSRKSGLALRAIDLAHTPAFTLGGVEVRPQSRELIAGDRGELLEPLVMQVLVALHSAKGATLSRDDLIDACWGGRAVSDDAISRVASRLRSLGKALGGFEVETIPKIGYRLLCDRGGQAAAPMRLSRRRLALAGGAAAVAGLGGLAAWRSRSPAETSPQAELLIQKGMEALQNNDALDPRDAGSTLQAIAFLTEATELAPQSDTAWGALTLAYAVRKKAADPTERPGLDARARAAARIALDLDPVNARALGGLRLLDPVYRNWEFVERADRAAAAKNPRLPILLFILADMLGNVGRWREAASFSTKLDRKRFLIPGADRKLIIDLWGSGDLAAADRALEVAVKQWPQNPQIWRIRMAYLMFTGRAREALATVRDSADRAIELSRQFYATAESTSAALAGTGPAATAMAGGYALLEEDPRHVLDVAQSFVALGASAAAFELMEGYYFGTGKWARLAPKGGDQDRVTSALFQPVMQPLWRTPHFAQLLERIGLEGYWRKSGRQPDFRRG